MTNRIIELTDSLSNKIAAGEVVERPASIVKELVENAIDANSTMIDIVVEEAGLARITVIDNGEGIMEKDVSTAFLRHATSKIKTETDLFRIRSLGFRGEALPSIASVAKVTMTTATGEGAGIKITLVGGKEVEKTKSQARKGTKIEVSDLFYNVPARLKYLKSLPTELGNIIDVVNRLALSYPSISFRLSHNKKPLLQTSGNGDLKQVIAAIYGVSIAKKAVPIDAESLDFKIFGYAVLPEVSRSSRNYISTLVNGRFIKNFALVKAIQEGYHTLLPINRYPVIILHIHMDPIIVDVNVHPAKLEVRLSKEKELGQFITKTIKDMFHKLQLIPNGDISTKQNRTSTQLSFHLDKPKAENIKENASFFKPDEQLQKNQSEPPEIPTEPLEKGKSFITREENAVYDTFLDSEEPTEKTPSTQESKRLPKMYPIGQMHATYILAQNENGLYIIDQHAAQERIKYEFYREKVGEVTRELQELIVPLVLDFSNDEFIKIKEQTEKLKAAGVFIEPFGQNSFIVRSHPVWFPSGKEEETIREVIDQALNEPAISVHKLREKAAIMMSCKKSIKANHHLNYADMEKLLDTLSDAADPFTCPHGRPVIIQYTTYELEKLFKRVM